MYKEHSPDVFLIYLRLVRFFRLSFNLNEEQTIAKDGKTVAQNTTTQFNLKQVETKHLLLKLFCIFYCIIQNCHCTVPVSQMYNCLQNVFWKMQVTDCEPTID